MGNPYVHRSMLTTSQMFFGRREELGLIFNLLEGKQSISVVGERRIGKSSLLYCLSLPDIQARLGKSLQDGYIYVYADLSQYTNADPPAFFGSILGIMKKKARKWIRRKAEAAVEPELFSDVITDLSEKGITTVLLLDEFDSVASNHKFDIDFYNYLRSLANANKLCYVTASKERLVNLCHLSVASSPFFNICVSVPLGLLDRQSAIDLIQRPSLEAGLPLTDDVDLVLKQAGRHPFLIQMFCFYLFSQKAAGGKLYQTLALDLFRQEATDHFRNFWLKLGREDQSHFLEFARQPTDLVPPSALLDSSACREFVALQKVQSDAPEPEIGSIEASPEPPTRKRRIVRIVIATVCSATVIALVLLAIYLDPIQGVQGLIFLVIPALFGVIGIRELVRRRSKK